MRAIRTSAPWALLAILIISAWGETMIEMSLKDLVRASDLVIQGRVVKTSSRWGDEKHSTIWTDYVIKVRDVLRGNVQGDSIVMTQQGGALEGKILRVGSNPELLEGDEVILMLAKADFLHGMARGDSRPKYTIVGVAQGTYYLSRDRGVAFRDYAQLAIVPRPDLKPAQNPPATKEVLGAEIERLREAQKKNPDDPGLARRLAEAEQLYSSAPELPRRKPLREKSEAPTAQRKQADLGAKPGPPLPSQLGQAEEGADVRPGSVEREKALRASLEASEARFKRIVQPVPLDELKQRIREAGNEAK
jgi:hypothetical protein